MPPFQLTLSLFAWLLLLVASLIFFALWGVRMQFCLPDASIVGSAAGHTGCHPARYALSRSFPLCIARLVYAVLFVSADATSPGRSLIKQLLAEMAFGSCAFASTRRTYLLRLTGGSHAAAGQQHAG